MLLLTNQDVERVLDMKTCLQALETGYRDLLRNDATYRPRSDTVVTSAPTTRYPDAHFRFGGMEGACRSLGTFAIRLKSDVSHTVAGRLQKYCGQPGSYYGIVMLFALHDAAPLAIIHDGFIQHMRGGNRWTRGQVPGATGCLSDRQDWVRWHGAGQSVGVQSVVFNTSGQGVQPHQRASRDLRS